jgi:hypothetical protein
MLLSISQQFFRTLPQNPPKKVHGRRPTAPSSDAFDESRKPL